MRLVLLLALFWLPQSGSGQFTISSNGARIGTEEFTVLRSGSGFVATGRTRLQAGGATVEVESRMELDSELNPISYEYRAANQTIEMDIGAEVTAVEITVDGEVTRYDIRFPPGGMIVDDNFFHHYMLLLDRLGSDGGGVDVFVPQQLTVGRLEVVRSGEDTFDLTTENLRLRASTDAAGRLIRLVAPDSSVVVER